MHAIILFAHGSRDPLWHEPINDVSRRITALSPETIVRCAFLELTHPDLPTVVDELIGEGSTHIRVVPMFLGVGRHAREDLPALIEAAKNKHPNIDITCQPAVCEQIALLDLLAQIALKNPNDVDNLDNAWTGLTTSGSPRKG